MNIRKSALEIATTISLAISMLACNSNNSIEQQLSIPQWKDAQKGAVALTFDDWTPGHPSIVVPELQNRKMVATFNVITGNVGDWEPLRQAAALGHEVANHSVTHPHPYGISFNDEIEAAKRKIEAEIPQQKVFTYAYPYGEVTDSLRQHLVDNGYCAARGVKTPETDDFVNSDSIDYFDTKAYSVMTETTLNDFAAQLTKVEQGGGMLTYLYHSVYSDSVKDFSYAWVKDTMFRQQMDTLMHYNLWVDTYANIIRYHRQHKAAKFETVKSTSNSYVFRLTTDQPFENPIPMTIMFTSDLNKCHIEHESQLKVMQNEKRLPVKRVSIKENGEQIFLYDQFIFDAIPNAGDIVVEFVNSK